MTISTKQDTPLLLLKNVSKTFKKDLFKKQTQALSNVTLSFNPGVCTGLLGHNGAGKTTAIKAILNLVKLDKGAIYFNGKQIVNSDRKFFGYMPETNKLPSNLTVLETLSSHYSIMKPEIARSARKQAMDAALEAAGLTLHKQKKIGSLSKGLARRLAWVLATIHKPRLLILDEPFSGLDPWGRIQMESWIKEIKQQGTTIVLTTHELWAIETLCDEFIILNNGQQIYPLGEEAQKPVNFNAFQLKVSGASEEQIMDLYKKHSAPKWQHLEQQGHTYIITFSEYEEALPWVQICVANNWILLSFEQKKLVKGNELLSYFDPNRSS